jgi:hypothetical protein
MLRYATSILLNEIETKLKRDAYEEDAVIRCANQYLSEAIALSFDKLKSGYDNEEQTLRDAYIMTCYSENLLNDLKRRIHEQPGHEAHCEICGLFDSNGERRAKAG